LICFEDGLIVIHGRMIRFGFGPGAGWVLIPQTTSK